MTRNLFARAVLGDECGTACSDTALIQGELPDSVMTCGSSPLALVPREAEATLPSPAPRRRSPLPLRERDRVRGGFGQPFAQDWSPPAAHAAIRGRA